MRCPGALKSCDVALSKYLLYLERIKFKTFKILITKTSEMDHTIKIIISLHHLNSDTIAIVSSFLFIKKAFIHKLERKCTQSKKIIRQLN
jgi:hypothetical protein